MNDTTKLIVSSLVAIVATGAIGTHGEMSDGLRVIGIVGMYYLFLVMAYEVLSWIEWRYRGKVMPLVKAIRQGRAWRRRQRKTINFDLRR